MFCFLYLLNFTWFKWGDLIVDAGREMYIPLELSQGKLLYRDIFYLYGPFSPYFNAILFKTLGVHLHSLIASGIITTALTGILIYKISRIFLNILSSTLAVLTFLFVFAFGQYVYFGNYNFIIPYSYSAIHGILFSLLALYFFYRSFLQKLRPAFGGTQGFFFAKFQWLGKFYTFLHHKKAKTEYIYCIFMVLALLCRLEIGLELILSVILTVIIYGLSHREPFKRIFYNLLIYAVLPFVFAASVYSLFLIKSFDIMQKSNFIDIGFKNININNTFTGWLSGAQDIPGNTWIMFKSFLYYIFLCIFFILGGSIITYIYLSKSKRKRIAFSLLTGLVFIGGSFIFFKGFFTYTLQYRCLPLICLVTILVSAWRFIKMKNKTEHLFIVTISLFSLFLMMRTLFYVWAGHYGFYILVPGMIIYYVFFFKIAAEFIKSDIVKRFFRLGFLCIFILFIISHFAISRLCYLAKTLKVLSPRGVLYVFDNDRENRCKELIGFLRENTGKKENLVVFPEGLTVNFLSERKNPLYYYIYLPLDLAKAGVIDNIISDMKDKNVDYVALVQRDTSEYGHAIFGKDYAEPLWKYISENYILYKQFGPFPFTSQDYGIALFKRKA